MATPDTPDVSAPAADATPDTPAPKPRRRAPARKAAATAAEPVADQAPAPEAAPAPARKTRRRAASAVSVEAAPADAEPAVEAPPAPEEAVAEPARKPRRRRAAAPAAEQAVAPGAEAVQPTEAPTEPAEAPVAEPAPIDAEAVEPVAAVAVADPSPVDPVPEAPEVVAEPVVAEPASDAEAAADDAPAEAIDPAEGDVRRRRRRRGRGRGREADEAAADDAGDAATVTATVAQDGPAVEPPSAEEAQEAQEAAAPAVQRPARARIALADDARRAPVFEPGRDTPPRVQERLARWHDAHGALRLPDTDALVQLLAELQDSAERVDVDEAVWTLLARRGDLNHRIDHLSALYPQGLDEVALPGAQGLRACQREAAFFAACVGACALADDPELDPAAELALAWQLVQAHFGAERLAVACAPARQAAWQALLGDTAPRWCAPGEPLEALDAEVLLVDARDGLPADVPALPAATWLWVLCPPGLLADRTAAAAWLGALDRSACGAAADWAEGADEAVLAPLLLRRRFSDVAEQWPAWASAERTIEHSEDERAALAPLHDTLRGLLARWQRSGFCADVDQLALQRTLRAVAQLDRAAALGALTPLVQEALAAGAKRVVVFCADEALTGPMAEVLRGEYVPALALPAGDDAEPVLRAFRDAPGPQVLLVADDPLGPRVSTHPHRPVLICLDGAGDAPRHAARLARVRSPRTLREVPVWQLRPSDLPALPAAPAQGLLRGEALAAWLGALQAALGSVSVPADPSSVPTAAPSVAPDSTPA
jgi:hypothetical protein